MKINNKIVTGNKFAYDKCHKIYILESESDIIEAENMSYEILPISMIEETFNNSCPLRFINSWNFESYVEQGEDATFEQN